MGWDRALLCGVNWRDGAGRWGWIVFVVARRHRVAGGVRCFGIASAAAIMCWVTNNLHNMLSRSVTALLPHQESQPRLQASTTPRRTFLTSEFCLVLCSRAFGCFALNGVESPVKPSPPPPPPTTPTPCARRPPSSMLSFVLPADEADGVDVSDREASKSASAYSNANSSSVSVLGGTGSRSRRKQFIEASLFVGYFFLDCCGGVFCSCVDPRGERARLQGSQGARTVWVCKCSSSSSSSSRSFFL